MTTLFEGLTAGLVGGIEGGSSAASTAHLFKITVTTDNTGASLDTQFELPLDGSSTYNFDWTTSDGQSGTHVANTDLMFTFPASGTYTISIGGTNKLLPALDFGSGGDPLKLIAINSWGNIAFEDFNSGFMGCDSLLFVSNDRIDVSTLTDLTSCFRNIDNLSKLDMSAWNNMPLCTNFTGAFRQGLFTELILDGMDTSAATTLSGTFRQLVVATLDVSSLDTSSCVNFQNCFNATSADVDTSMWDWSSVNNGVAMYLNSGFTQVNYDKLLLSLSQQTLQSGVTLDAGTAKFGAGAPAAARQSLVDNDLWTIIDGGPA